MTHITEYDAQFRTARLVHGGLAVTMFGMTVACLVLSTQSEGSLGAGLPDAQSAILEPVLLILGIALIALAFALKHTLRTMRGGLFRRMIDGLARTIHRTGGGSAISILLPIGALCEAAGVLGLVLFILSGGESSSSYLLLAGGIIALALLRPTEEDKHNLMEIDKAQP